MHTISFPGLGIPEFQVHETAFTLFGMEVKWYGVILTFGILCALCLFYYLSRKVENLPENHLYNLALFTVPIGIIGARVIYVVTKWDDYAGNIGKMINIREGGLAIYGGIIFGGLTVFTYCRIAKLSFLKVADSVAPAVMVGQLIGRWGNFMNGEAYGVSAHVDTLFCRMMVDGKATHPTFLYESLWNLIGLLLLLLIFYRRKKFDGEIVCLYVGWYGFGRTLIEILRDDSLYLIGDKTSKFSIKFSVFVGICSVILCVIGLLVFSRRAKKLNAEATYTSKFSAANLETVPEEAAEESASESEPEASSDAPEASESEEE
ncbi:MAG: prolipoprotein diacylglyceryl transferase [Oscillospiraceae bacterium]|nr:prolipoprotein diacylglyceryl transferase [Oscillospiraceae bacterium]